MENNFYIVAIPKTNNEVLYVYEWVALIEDKEAAETYAIKFDNAIIIELDNEMIESIKKI